MCVVVKTIFITNELYLSMVYKHDIYTTFPHGITYNVCVCVFVLAHAIVYKSHSVLIKNDSGALLEKWLRWKRILP